MLTVVCADKGAPGATSTALGVAAGWPSGPVVLIEADPGGGDLGMTLTRNRQYLPASPTVATVAAGIPDGGADALEAAQPFTENVKVIPGFVSAENGHGMDDLWKPLAQALRASDSDVVVDVGRIWSSAPSMAMVEAADVVLVVARQSASSMLHTRERIRHLAVGGRELTIVPVAVSPDRDSAADTEALDHLLKAARLPVEPAAHLAWDPTGLAAISAAHATTSRAAARTRYVRSARTLAARIAEYRAHDLLREVI